MVVISVVAQGKSRVFVLLTATYDLQAPKSGKPCTYIVRAKLPTSFMPTRCGMRRDKSSTRERQRYAPCAYYMARLTAWNADTQTLAKQRTLHCVAMKVSPLFTCAIKLL